LDRGTVAGEVGYPPSAARRRLEDEVRSWRQSGLDIVVSLLTQEEVADLDLVQEAALCQARGLQFFSFPMVDRSVPSSRAATLDLVRELDKTLAEGKSVVIHCRQGIGRSALLAACRLASAGIDAEAAFRRISAARGCLVPETPEQRSWVVDFAREFVMPLPRK
jgi:protein-tyrosine phosphatase